jgi:hypothetical protein
VDQFSVGPGDLFNFPGEFVTHPITRAVLPYAQLFTVSRIVDGRIEFWPVRSDGSHSVPVDDMQGAYCDINAMKYFRAAWEFANPAPGTSKTIQ